MEYDYKRIMKFKLERENVEITGLDFSEGDPCRHYCKQYEKTLRAKIPLSLRSTALCGVRL